MLLHKEIMHIGKARHLKICEVIAKMKNEDSRGLKTEGRIMFPSSRTAYIEAKTQKGEETDNFNTCRTHMRLGTKMEAPGAQEFALGRLN